jgi:hypothetical protein
MFEKNSGHGSENRNINPSSTNGIFQKDIHPFQKDRASVLKEFHSITEINSHRYLKSRGIETIDSRFQGRVFSDKYNNVVFPHLDREGVSCLEKCNFDFKGNSRGGDKGLWCSNSYKTDTRLVITESPIDAISYHLLNPNHQTRYISFSGYMNQKQTDMLKSAIHKMPDHSKIILATDKDIVGDSHAKLIASFSTNKTHTLIRHTPDIGKDWNDQLKASMEIKSPFMDSKHHEMEMGKE